MFTWKVRPYWAADGGTGGQAAEPPAMDAAAETGEQPEEKAFTQAELDRIVGQRVADERAKADKRIEDARAEAERLATMNAEQRAEHERKQREAQLSQREADIARREMRAQVLDQLSEKGLPSSLADLVRMDSAETCAESLETVEAAFRQAVQKGVEDRLKTTAPKATQRPGAQPPPGTPTDSVRQKIEGLMTKG